MIDGMVSCFARASQLRSWLYAWYLGFVPGRWIVVKQGRRRHRRLESGGFVCTLNEEKTKNIVLKKNRTQEKEHTKRTKSTIALHERSKLLDSGKMQDGSGWVRKGRKH